MTVAFLPADPPGTATVRLDGAVVGLVEALPHLVHGDDPWWAAAARCALGLVARGRLLPGVSPAGFASWRAAVMEPADARLLDALGEPARAFADAVADALARSDGDPSPFGAPGAHHVPELRDWATDAAAGLDAGVRLSLRLDLVPHGPDDAPRLVLVVQVHPLAEPTRVADLADVWSGAAVGFGAEARLDALRAVRRAARFWTPLEQLLTRAVPDRIDLVDDDLADLLEGGAAALAAAGIALHRPRELDTPLTARAVAGARPAGVGLGDDPFPLDWEIALGDHPLTTEERAELVAAHRPLVRLHDRWVLVDPAVRRRAAQPSAGTARGVGMVGAALTGEVELHGERVTVRPTGWLAELRERLLAPLDPEPAPAGLTATLRDYQRRGLAWLHRMTSLGLGACLADDMGLGKTITLIALHLRRVPLGAGPTLVVCPASLLGNWAREFARFAPGVTVARFHGPDRALGPADVVLTTYATMRLDVELLEEHTWGLVVADEAQHVKNAASGTARALRTLPCAARVALTGTPVENDLDELWAILDWATPGLLGTRAGFRRRWADPIAGGDAAAAERFARLLGAFLLRRRKSDPGIVPELPAKTETDRYVPLTPEQAGLYAAVTAEALARIAGASGTERRGQVLALLTALKQIGNHPAQYARETDPVLAGRSGKLDLLDELLDTILAEDGSVLVFTQYVAMARLLERHLRERGIGAALLHGGTPVAVRDQLVARFQAGEVPVFLLSLRAAGTGLNLTRADHVVHYDRWWNPAVEDQATDRAYRIGQTRPVQVHRLVAEGTVEDRIAALLESKRALADAVLGGGEAGLSELTDAELAELVTLS